VDLPGIAQVIHDSALSEWLRSSLKAMPIVEAIHVMAAATVFGTILVVDLRLLGWPSVQRSFSRIHGELVRWTWLAFVVAVITGVLLFVVNSVTYYGNTAFRLKMVALLLAGVNMFVFERVTGRDAAAWDKGPTPASARFAGALSLTIWVSVLFIARWIGFTKGYDFSIPDNVNLDLNFGQ
jgi:hypothetical protein